jgi:septal ring factor EnvC (AmiA/AmiB activator)
MKRGVIAVAVGALIAVGGAAVARSADGPSPFDQINAKLTQLSAQIDQVNGSTGQLGSQLNDLDAKVSELDAKLAQVDSKVSQTDAQTVDISTDVQLLKQLANSTHDRLNATCTLVIRAEAWAWAAAGSPGPMGESPASCWRDWWAPSAAGTFTSMWVDPIPPGVPGS